MRTALVAVAAMTVVIYLSTCHHDAPATPEQVLRETSFNYAAAREWRAVCTISAVVRHRKPSEREEAELRIRLRRLSYSEFVSAFPDLGGKAGAKSADCMLLDIWDPKGALQGAKHVRVGFLRKLYDEDKYGGMDAVFIYNPGTSEEFVGAPDAFSQRDILDSGVVFLLAALSTAKCEPVSFPAGVIAGAPWELPNFRLHYAADGLVASARLPDKGTEGRSDLTLRLHPKRRTVEELVISAYVSQSGSEKLTYRFNYSFTHQRFDGSIGSR